MPRTNTKKRYITLAAAAELTPYSQEYLSLLARKGKLQARKIGRNWYTTNDWVQLYLSEQGIAIEATVADDLPVATLANDYSSNFSSKEIEQDRIAILASSIEKLSNVVASNELKKLEREQKVSSNNINKPNGKRSFGLLISAVVAMFLLVGGFGFGNVDKAISSINSFFKDADTIAGHFVGTHANEVLLLDKMGNVSIYGHIETKGQLRSGAPEGLHQLWLTPLLK